MNLKTRTIVIDLPNMYYIYDTKLKRAVSSLATYKKIFPLSEKLNFNSPGRYVIHNDDEKPIAKYSLPPKSKEASGVVGEVEF